MKRLTLLLSVVALTSSLWAAERPCDVKQTRTTGWGKERFSEFAEHINLYNDHNAYGLDYVQWKPNVQQGQGPKTQFWLFEPRVYGGFSRPLFDFFQLEVNGIKNNRLQPTADDIVLWRKDGLAGCHITMNFDGAKIIATWYLRPDSPVLWCSLRPAFDTLEPIRTITASFQAAPGGFAKDENDKVVWSGGYQQQTITPTRTIEQSTDPIALTPADAYLIFQDTKFDDAQGGPCYLTLDYASVLKAKLDMKNEPGRTLTIDVNPDMKEFRFGLWQQKNTLSNAAFMEMFKKNEAGFRVKSGVLGIKY